MFRSRLLNATAGIALAAGMVAVEAGAAAAATAPKTDPDVGAVPWWLMPASLPISPTQSGRRPDIIPVQAIREGTPQQQAQGQTAQPAPAITERPGVLTRQGVLVLEPSIEYQHTDINRFVVGGVAILDTVLVGSIEATQANRDAVTGTLGVRYGITDRLEGELRIPYMYRHDSTTNTVVNSNNTVATTSLTDHGLGDIEGAVHWQVNEGEGGWPFLVTNLRVKSTTGTGPFDTKRNALGIEEELATGSGFWGVEPSLTVIAPSDPAVFYANLGYLWNVGRSMNQGVANGRTVARVDPGDAIRMGVGMGISLNEKVSFSIGYQQDWIFGTRTKFEETGSFKSESLSVGSMTFGVNWQMSPDTALNVSIGIGVTNDAPDVRLGVRIPIAVKLF